MNKLLLLLFVASLFQSCRKEEPLPPYVPPPVIDYNVLPDATQEGKNTFGCKVNGKVWVPRVPLFEIYKQDIYSLVAEENGTGGLGIDCHLIDEQQQIDDWLEITVPNTQFTENQYVDFSVLYRDYHDVEFFSEKFSNSEENFVKITRIDSVKNIISGTFQFTLSQKSYPGIKIAFSEGRFDLNYNPD